MVLYELVQKGATTLPLKSFSDRKVAITAGAPSHQMGYSTIMAFPIFEDTFLAMLLGIIVAIVVAAIVTFILGYNEADRT